MTDATPAGGRRWPWPADLALATLAGGLHSLTYVHTGTLWWLQIACIGVLAARVSAVSPGRAFALGWLHGAAWLGGGVWWLFVSMHRYGGLPAPLAALAVALLCGALALYLGVAMAWCARGGDRAGGALPSVARFTAAWLAAELARGLLFTGFPWVASGYAQVDAPLAVLAPWVGVYGVGAAVAALAASVAALRRSRWRTRAGGAATLALVLVAMGLSGPSTWTEPAGSLDVTLLQPNVAQDEKFVLERLPATLAQVATALASARGPLVVAPETAVPLLPEQLDIVAPGYWAGLESRFSVPGRAALLGVPLGDERQGYTNSVVALSAGSAYRYDKVHLVPFGEFIPTGFRWFTNAMNIPLGDFARGPLDAPSFAFGGQRLAPNICYEDLFGEELARRFRADADAPTMFVNVSNIGWFGRTIAVEQHLQISRMRALEFQRPMLRATNTGATAIIDHRGVVTHALAPHTVGALDGTAEGRRGRTPFARWAAAFGWWPLAGAVLLLAWAGRRRG